ncbi:hypothetical protein BJ742DRAFT_810801 [Cladochytrium replicatum]|nr:hypothetical protein BJ742DRAFT_810801 [Cladochytrium replicatum]
MASKQGSSRCRWILFTLILLLVCAPLVNSKGSKGGSNRGGGRSKGGGKSGSTNRYHPTGKPYVFVGGFVYFHTEACKKNHTVVIANNEAYECEEFYNCTSGNATIVTVAGVNHNCSEIAKADVYRAELEDDGTELALEIAYFVLGPLGFLILLIIICLCSLS